MLDNLKNWQEIFQAFKGGFSLKSMNRTFWLFAWSYSLMCKYENNVKMHNVKIEKKKKKAVTKLFLCLKKSSPDHPNYLWGFLFSFLNL